MTPTFRFVKSRVDVLESDDDDEVMASPQDSEADDAQRALAALGETRRRMANRAHWPLRRHIAFGVLIGAMVASYALPLPLQMLVVAGALVATGLLVAADRRRDGFFVNGYRAGRTRRVALLYLSVALAGLVAAIVAKEGYGLVWMPLAVGAVLAVIGTLSSLAWERAYRADLGEGP